MTTKTAVLFFLCTVCWGACIGTPAHAREVTTSTAGGRPGNLLVTSLHQLHNGTTTSSPAWANGIINSNNSCYSEGRSVPYRYFIKSTEAGTSHFFTIQMDWTMGGLHALDYLTSYDATEDSAINLAGGPCGTISTSPPPGCSAPIDSLLLPDPTDSNNYSGTIPSDFFTKVNPGFVLYGPRYLKAYNVTIDSVGKYFFTGTSDKRDWNVKVYFTTDTTGSIGFFWGGHLAEGSDVAWGFGNGSASVTGAPYHMRAINLDDGGGANKHRSIQAGVICLPPDVSIVCDSDTVCAGTTATYVCRDTSDANTWTWTVINGTIVGDSTLDSVVFHVNSGVTPGQSVTVIVEACDTNSGCPDGYCCDEDSVVLPVDACNNPPEVTCPGDTSLFVCNLGEICIPGFSCYDPDDDLVSCVVSMGTLSGDTVCFTPISAGIYEIILTATDAFNETAVCTTLVTITVNSPPVATCPDDDTLFVCDLSQVCISGFNVSDPDGNLQSSTINGQLYDPGDPYCFAADSGINTLVLVCADSCAAWAQCTVNVEVVKLPVDSCVGRLSITIEKSDKASPGVHEFIDITLDSGSLELSHFDFLIAYDASALNFLNATRGDLYDSPPDGCEWEYFTFRHGPFGNCDGQCPSGLLRLVGIADMDDSPMHPACFTLPTPFVLSTLRFLVRNDQTFECTCVPISFFWMECGDNAISSVSGDTFYIDRAIYDFEGNLIWDEEDNDQFPEDARIPYVGAPDSCLNSEPGEPSPIRLIDFINGGIDIVCAESISSRGDINWNGVRNEVADAVVFTNYFVYGLGAFHINVKGQVAATDVNADGLTLTVGDLVYLIRIITGDAMPYPKLSPVVASYTVDNGIISVDADMGAAYVVVEDDVTPTLLADNMEMKHAYDAQENVTRILVFSMQKGQTFAGAFLDAKGKVVSIEMATYEGAPVTPTLIPTEFALHQNFPNPFNPITTISFALPVATDYDLVIYNVMGQEVATFTGHSEPGIVKVDWDAPNYASGVYLYKLTAGNFTATKKMVLLK